MAAFAVQTSEEGFSKLQIFMQQLIDWGVGAGGRIIGAILIFVVGRFLISFIKKLLSKLLMKRHIDAGIQSFIKSLVNILLTILLIIAVIGKLGVETTSFAALLASAGVAVGMALSGNLQNFAGGLIVLLFRPFKVGDWIESQGVSGTVREIQIFHTILTTADNKVIYIPNGALSSGTVTNYSREETRRVDWVIGVEYGENYDKVESTVRRSNYSHYYHSNHRCNYRCDYQRRRKAHQSGSAEAVRRSGRGRCTEGQRYRRCKQLWYRRYC